jgi:hypothetical protein
MVPLGCNEAAAGVTETLTAGSGVSVIVAVAVLVESAMLVAVRLTMVCEVIEFGAV